MKTRYKFVRYASNGNEPVSSGERGHWFPSSLKPGHIFFAGRRLWMLLKVLSE